MTTDIIEAAKEVFEFNKEANEIYAVEDKTFFLESAKSHAFDYAKKGGFAKPVLLKRYEVFSTEKAPDSDNQKNADEKPLEEMLLDELKDYAVKNGIELTKTLKAEILQEIIEWNATQNHVETNE